MPTRLLLPRTRATFYAATARHPRTYRGVSLELSTDFEGRVDVLRRFAVDPSEFRQHLGWQG